MGRKDKWVLQLKKTKDTISTLNCEHPLLSFTTFQLYITNNKKRICLKSQD